MVEVQPFTFSAKQLQVHSQKVRFIKNKIKMYNAQATELIFNDVLRY